VVRAAVGPGLSRSGVSFATLPVSSRPSLPVPCRVPEHPLVPGCRHERLMHPLGRRWAGPYGEPVDDNFCGLGGGGELRVTVRADPVAVGVSPRSPTCALSRSSPARTRPRRWARSCGRSPSATSASSTRSLPGSYRVGPGGGGPADRDGHRRSAGSGLPFRFPAGRWAAVPLGARLAVHVRRSALRFTLRLSGLAWRAGLVGPGQPRRWGGLGDGHPVVAHRPSARVSLSSVGGSSMPSAPSAARPCTGVQAATVRTVGSPGRTSPLAPPPLPTVLLAALLEGHLGSLV